MEVERVKMFLLLTKIQGVPHAVNFRFKKSNIAVFTSGVPEFVLVMPGAHSRTAMAKSSRNRSRNASQASIRKNQISSK
jgi:hypothetical protein